MFGVYILHSGFIGERLLAVEVADDVGRYNTVLFPLDVILWAILVLIVATVVDMVRKRFWEKPLTEFLHKITWIEAGMRKLNEE